MYSARGAGCTVGVLTMLSGVYCGCTLVSAVYCGCTHHAERGVLRVYWGCTHHTDRGVLWVYQGVLTTLIGVYCGCTGVYSPC